jgi:hypothetical protein
MEHPETGSEHRLERSSDELEERIERLDDHIDDAKEELKDRKADAGQDVDEVAGDWEGKSEGAQRAG